MPVGKGLLVAAVEPVGKERSGLAPLPALSLVVLHSCSELNPEKFHTASESVTETAAAVNSPKPAAAEAVVAGFVAFESAAGAVWPMSSQTEAVSYRSL